MKLRPGHNKDGPLVIGLTGGIGSGKSVVAKIFETLGIPVYYADTEARRLMNEDPVLKAGIISLFGEKVYGSGQLDRKYLSSVVFNDPAKLEQLNRLVHPATIRDAEEWRRRQQAPYVIKEAALLFESGANRSLDAVIGVSAPEELRVSRVMARDGISKEEVMKRIQRQMDERKKIALCDWVIFNDEKEFLVPQVLAIHTELLTAQ
jgi:dephospho-CoA kinase